MFTYQKTNRYFALLGDGLEELGKKEIAALGGTDLKAVYRGLYFDADQASLYRIIYSSRYASRILAQLLRFDCHSDKYLYKTAQKIDWFSLLSKNDTFAVHATVVHSNLRHSQFAALRLKDAIVDLFRESCGERPSIDKHNPDLALNLHIDNNKATISVDLAGGSLHRRGYRKEAGTAPLQETLAAAIIGMTGWDGQRPLYDPLCGSGTLLAEALMAHGRIPASVLRDRFGVFRLPDFDAAIWQDMVSEAKGGIRKVAAGLISGSDISAEVVKMAITNLAGLPGGGQVALKARPFTSLSKLGNHVIVSNPPYGLRSQPGKPMAEFMGELGRFLKNRCQGSEAYLYLGDPELAGHLGLRADWKKSLSNGGLAGVLVKFSL